jgi:CII-binding regulator of phage lambda lysogenization HflD
MLYSKLNGLMRKLVLKHREVDNLLSRLNDKITENSDILEQDKLLNQTRKCYEEVISDLRRKISSMESTSAKECLIRESLRVEN